MIPVDDNSFTFYFFKYMVKSIFTNDANSTLPRVFNSLLDNLNSSSGEAGCVKSLKFLFSDSILSFLLPWCHTILMLYSRGKILRKTLRKITNNLAI